MHNFIFKICFSSSYNNLRFHEQLQTGHSMIFQNVLTFLGFQFIIFFYRYCNFFNGFQHIIDMKKTLNSSFGNTGRQIGENTG
uniref:Uncharacterized protein n=1 Tax=Aquila chrysaetos chrysaetos TaxID=223781 RepID=A0A663FI43_AQUCH